MSAADILSKPLCTLAFCWGSTAGTVFRWA
jgi:hypothetical protein